MYLQIHRHVLVPLIWTFIFSLDWDISQRSFTSTASGFRCLKCKRVSQLSGTLRAGGESERDSLALRSKWESCLNTRPRFHCHQLVVAHNVLSVNSYVAVVYTHTLRTVECRAGGGVCMVSSPAYFVIAPSVSLLGWVWRREEGWPVLNSVL